MSFDKNKHLGEVLDTHKMCHVQDFVNKVKKRREEIKAKMHDHYVVATSILRLVLAVLLSILPLM